MTRRLDKEDIMTDKLSGMNMKELQNFTNGIFNLDVKVEEENILFNIKDVARALGFEKLRPKMVVDIIQFGGLQLLNIFAKKLAKKISSYS